MRISNVTNVHYLYYLIIQQHYHTIIRCSSTHYKMSSKGTSRVAFFKISLGIENPKDREISSKNTEPAIVFDCAQYILSWQNIIISTQRRCLRLFEPSVRRLFLTKGFHYVLITVLVRFSATVPIPIAKLPDRVLHLSATEYRWSLLYYNIQNG